jgi:hypothetical protein
MNARVLDFKTGQPLKIVKATPNTPLHAKLSETLDKLAKASKYTCHWDDQVIAKLETRFADSRYALKKLKSPLIIKDGKLYIDTYHDGDVHECVLDAHHAQLKAHGKWNKPFPMPADISILWRALYNAFETNRSSKYREFFKDTTVILGLYSDPFMFLDRKYKITQETIEMLEHYGVSYIIRTRSDLVAHDEYMDAFTNYNCERIEIRVDRTDDQMNKLIEAGAPSSLRRLKAAQKLSKRGFKVYIRQHVIEPIYDLNDIHRMMNYGIEGIITERPNLYPDNIKMYHKATGTWLQGKNERIATFIEELHTGYHTTLPYIIAKCQQYSLECITE